ncbi:MAG: helix-turn-helix transcriptional regulator [Dehalococcoidia bacterium]|nr:helix-turn-helix transcriptional regulator [Dehalococcoidia bacterium]MCA9856033.1 helix-turn-helix transcriptional regulator [Dehalococcoidia bacterium]MCB9482438.1 helix-turn-helix transcriptional regulator [Dehalococcoidia bacterium]MCB9491257.1 helix-turn-helix transcriptional regulator [Dehalococcoidia bacterium]
MRRASFADMNCSIAQALEVIGEWWTPLIVRDLMLGVSRFDDFQSRLGISRNVLTERLGRLESLGIVERAPYQEKPPRYDYRLTEKGRDLWVVMTAMREWGDRWAAPDGAPIVTLHRVCGHETTIVPTCSHCGEVLDARDLKATHGPARGDALPVPRH